MEKRLLKLLFCLLLPFTSGATSSFTLEEPEAEWLEIVAGFKEAKTLRGRFEETRTNPFHRVPKRFEGTIRWKACLGFSLQYAHPSRTVISITRDTMRVDRDGEIRSIGTGDGQAQVIALISRLFLWDLDWIAREFSSSGELEKGNGWKLELVPRDPTYSETFDKLVVQGDTNQLDLITLDLRAGRTVEIKLDDIERDVCFSESELNMAFLLDDG